MQNTMEMGVNLVQIRVFFMAKEANKLFTCYMYLNLSVTEIMWLAVKKNLREVVILNVCDIEFTREVTEYEARFKT